MKLLLLQAFFVVCALPAQAEKFLVSLDGMVCITCQPKIETAFAKIDGVSSVLASAEKQAVCLETDGDTPVTADVLQKSLKNFSEYTVMDIVAQDACPLESREAKSTVRLWSDVDALDARVITHREPFDINRVPEAGKYIVVDFGADWCTPCRLAEKTLKSYLTTHQDTAVRAVAMEGRTPAQTFALPVARQHLKNAAGLPYFLVFGPDKKPLYKGSNIDKALSIIDKHRRN